jgi:hypothetical protein
MAIPGGNFEFEGIEYAPERYNGASDTLQCESCDLKVGRRKLCLNNMCKCGECGKYTDDRYVFKALNATNEYKLYVENENRDFKIESLEKEILSLKKENKLLVEQRNRVYAENAELIKKINKYVSLINKARSSIKALFGENLI